MNDIKFIYCDFDGTITKEDSVNNFLTRFADKKWLGLENKWINGEIGARECLFEQVKLIPKLSLATLTAYIDSIEIDTCFIEFYNFSKKQGYEFVILSDGFDFFIEKTLERYNLAEIKFFANSLIRNNDGLSLSFNSKNTNCQIDSGICKCSKTEIDDFYYIGDGLSDVCIARKATTLFAKKNLQKYCDEHNIGYINFKTFEDILLYFLQERGINAKPNCSNS